MNKIGYIPSYGYNVLPKDCSKELYQLNPSVNKCENYSNEYMSSDISAASRAYGLNFINKNKTIPQTSLKNMVRLLESQGKVEGKDFEIDSALTMGNTVLTLKNKRGQKELVIHYDGGNYNYWSGYEVFGYKDEKFKKIIGRDSEGNIMCTTQVYDKNDKNFKYLNEFLTYDTTPQQYEQYLKDNNLDYKITYSSEENDKRSLRIDVFDKNKQRTGSVLYYYGKNDFDEHCQFVSRLDIDKNGKEYRRLTYDENNVEVTTYI